MLRVRFGSFEASREAWRQLCTASMQLWGFGSQGSIEHKAGSAAGIWALPWLGCQAPSCPTQSRPSAKSGWGPESVSAGPFIGLAAAAATLYAGAASMESENLAREEEDAKSRGRCHPGTSQPLKSIETVGEKFTGIEFPLHVRLGAKCGDGGVQYHLLGTAVRCMLGACSYKYARAYAVAVYIEEGQASRRWLPGDNSAGSGSSSSSSSEALRRELLGGVGAGRMLRLVMDRDVEGHHIAKGFDRSMIPRVRDRQGGFKKGDGKSALKQFTQVFFRERTLKKGTIVELLWRPDNSLVTSIDGRVVSVIHSPILCQSLFDVYFGPDNIFSKYKNTAFEFLGRDKDTA